MEEFHCMLSVPPSILVCNNIDAGHFLDTKCAGVARVRELFPYCHFYPKVLPSPLCLPHLVHLAVLLLMFIDSSLWSHCL